MAERLKDMFYSSSSIKSIAETFLKIYPDFEAQKFYDLFFEKAPSLELKQKMRHLTECFYEFLPRDYHNALNLLKQAAPNIKGFEAMSMPDYVQLYGLDNWETSLEALKYFTVYASGEFAIREFLRIDHIKTLKTMETWADDPDARVRRLASEGCRPRLPWAAGVPVLKQTPQLVIPILEKLKNDSSEDVRRSVANNLNDISKDHPEIALEICTAWYGKNSETDSLVKHACRTLLKSGHSKALQLFGFADPENININDIQLNFDIKIGQNLNFSFNMELKKESQKIRLEYEITFLTSTGKKSTKVFQIIEKEFNPGNYKYARKHSFQNMTTRKHYPGEHSLAIIVNGEKKAAKSFLLERD